MTNHKWEKCPPVCKEYSQCPCCVVADSAPCLICGAVVNELTTDCPGRKMTQDEKNAVYNGNLDYIDGEWVEHGDPQYN